MKHVSPLVISHRPISQSQLEKVENEINMRKENRTISKIGLMNFLPACCLRKIHLFSNFFPTLDTSFELLIWNFSLKSNEEKAFFRYYTRPLRAIIF